MFVFREYWVLSPTEFCFQRSPRFHAESRRARRRIFYGVTCAPSAHAAPGSEQPVPGNPTWPQTKEPEAFKKLASGDARNERNQRTHTHTNITRRRCVRNAALDNHASGAPAGAQSEWWVIPTVPVAALPSPPANLLRTSDSFGYLPAFSVPPRE